MKEISKCKVKENKMVTFSVKARVDMTNFQGEFQALESESHGANIVATQQLQKLNWGEQGIMCEIKWELSFVLCLYLAPPPSLLPQRLLIFYSLLGVEHLI